ncbi:hypothetical protein P3L10_003504 [Capsicum annuum]
MEQLHLKFQKQYNNALFRFCVNARGKILLNEVSLVEISHKHLNLKDAIDSLMKRRITLVIDRRLSIVKSVNTVVVASDGQIVESRIHEWQFIQKCNEC